MAGFLPRDVTVTANAISFVRSEIILANSTIDGIVNKPRTITSRILRSDWDSSIRATQSYVLRCLNTATLTQINGGQQGDVIEIWGVDGQTLTIENGTGNIFLGLGDTQYIIDSSTKNITFRHNGVGYAEIARPGRNAIPSFIWVRTLDYIDDLNLGIWTRTLDYTDEIEAPPWTRTFHYLDEIEVGVWTRTLDYIDEMDDDWVRTPSYIDEVEPGAWTRSLNYVDEIEPQAWTRTLDYIDEMELVWARTLDYTDEIVPRNWVRTVDYIDEIVAADWTRTLDYTDEVES